VRFWDASAIIPLCLKEAASESVERLISSGEDLVVWWMTRVECLSALAQRRREGLLKGEAESRARALIAAFYSAWSEVQPNEVVRQRAERLLMVHPLRVADSLQLAAALIWAQESPQGLEVVCLDQNLREAALKEGFTVLP
jgi:predicted nucleic acid-binding protein